MCEIKRLIVDFENNRVLLEFRQDHTPPFAYTGRKKLPETDQFKKVLNVEERNQQFIDWSRGKLGDNFRKENMKISFTFINSYQHGFTKKGFDINSIHVFDHVQNIEFTVEPEVKQD